MVRVRGGPEDRATGTHPRPQPSMKPKVGHTEPGDPAGQKLGSQDPTQTAARRPRRTTGGPEDRVQGPNPDHCHKCCPMPATQSKGIRWARG